MQDVTVPPLIPPTTEGSISTYAVEWAEREPSRVMMSRPGPDGWDEVTAAQFRSDVDGLARGLVAAGIETGDRVAVMSRTRYEWTLVDFALWSVGAVPVPVYETSSRDQVEWIVQDSGAVAMIVEDQHLLGVVSSVRESLPTLRDVWCIDGGSLDELVAAGQDVPVAEVERRRAALVRADLATIIYTSGTTGRPKGCELTHDNFMGLAENAAERLAVVIKAPEASTLLFLPLAHVFARFIQVVCVHAGARLGHTPDPRKVLTDLAGFRPSFLLSVPRVFEKIYNSAEQKAEAGGRGRIFRWAARVAQDYSRAQDGGRVPVALRAQHALADTLVYGKLRAAMGGKVDYAISGGAALGERLGHFYRGIGVLVLEGYGLTETTAPATVNTPDMIRIGTVGRPFPGVSVRIADDGEVQVKGVNVMRGYHDDPEATAEVLRDGWFRTGDLGELDQDGFLRITGRTKELLVTAGGKNVSPGPLEDRLRAFPLVSQCMVVGEGRPFVAALITLDEEMLPTWAAAHGLEGLTVEEARTHEAVRAEVQKAVDAANDTVSRAESIRTFTILGEDFTAENGLLTPSMKLKRGRITDKLQDEIDALYTRSAPRRG
ncbi:long-chain fatty acid--CoA ligase [Ornithinimicrobium sp. CNJ-824]|uniref:AMP-dependent synthetase/ligase n=1 Tax=Ornithinimicrobium sp. CNJ-824 TaxID=1904966 RepID=UPI00095C073E|nr:AMP-dependent synthetase/ligase [Ornithinimicrobium sp. CNJ-824]OLT20045.1 long-chain fatty acid--CoA ligase [Ornithinimicrobium sp. CNJ-824]